ncbi:MAG: phosphonoacetate hydrolase [Cyclobacteriaceae bacterium]|nr:phosphonoacetate hydrolase [Cyclobacteriaceae bacterium]
MIKVNNRSYNTKNRPVIAICMDGTSYDYYQAAKDKMPNLQRFIKDGSMGLVNSVIPSFTNPNNIAIATGVTPEVNGICGNFYYDKSLDREVMMNDPKYMSADTIFAAFSNAGKKVAVVTTKDKLRKMLNKGLTNGICFSAEFSVEASLEENGIENVIELMGKPNPTIYDPDISVYCIEAGAKLLEKEYFDLIYLTTTDFVQHKYAPADPEAIEFLSKVDHWFGELDRLGAIIAITADHGMSAKTLPDGSPKVQFIETLLADAGINSRVILPITDPYVVHHGALGSYGTVYLEEQDIPGAKALLKDLEGIEFVLENAEAVEQFNLPGDRIGELVVLSDEHTVIGRSRDWHDLDQVKVGLRSHGGIHESVVPMILNKKLNPVYMDKLTSGKARNFDVFDFLCNGTID